MKLTILTQIIFACTVSITALSIPKLTQAQLPPVVDNNQNNLNSPEPSKNSARDNTPQVITASASTIRVSCQDLTTVVQKGDRQAVMVNWNYNGFGQDFTPQKRCQMVSERLQQVANLNGGTFKDLQLASGTVNSQPVICALQSTATKCNRQNLLFTLKPENARNPEAVIQKIFSFAQDGSSSLNESASSQPKSDVNLGTWEQKAFPESQSPTNKSRNANTGF